MDGFAVGSLEGIAVKVGPIDGCCEGDLETEGFIVGSLEGIDDTEGSIDGC